MMVIELKLRDDQEKIEVNTDNASDTGYQMQVQKTDITVMFEEEYQKIQK